MMERDSHDSASNSIDKDEERDIVLKEISESISSLTKRVEDLQASVARLTSYNECIILSYPTDTAKENCADARIAHHLLPVNNIFSVEHMASGVSSVLPFCAVRSCTNIDISVDVKSMYNFTAALVFSSQPNDKRVPSSFAVCRLNSDIRLMIVKFLIKNSKHRARAISLGAFQTSSQSCSDVAGISLSETAGSLSSDRSNVNMVQAAWMQSGYVRPEIYDEVRTEQDGHNSTEPAPRSKKRKISADEDIKDHVSRAVVKAVYQKLHSFLRISRDHSRKMFVQQLGYIINPDAEAKVSWPTPGEISGNVLSVALTHPFPGCLRSPGDEEKNNLLLEELVRTKPEMKAILEYKVVVTQKSGNRTKLTVRKEVDILKIGLNFCTDVTQSASFPKFMASSPDALRMAYVVAVAFRTLVTMFEEDRRRILESPNDATVQEGCTENLKAWNQFMPGVTVTDRLVRDGILHMTEEQYSAVCPANILGSVGAGYHGDDAEDEELDEIEYRMV